MLPWAPFFFEKKENFPATPRPIQGFIDIGLILLSGADNILFLQIFVDHPLLNFFNVYFVVQLYILNVKKYYTHVVMFMTKSYT